MGNSFRFAKFEKRPSDVLWWRSKLAGVKRSYRSKLTLYLSQIKCLLGNSHKFVICSGSVFHQCLLSSLIYNTYYHSATFLPNLSP